MKCKGSMKTHALSWSLLLSKLELKLLVSKGLKILDTIVIPASQYLSSDQTSHHHLVQGVNDETIQPFANGHNGKIRTNKAWLVPLYTLEPSVIFGYQSQQAFPLN